MHLFRRLGMRDYVGSNSAHATYAANARQRRRAEKIALLRQKTRLQLSEDGDIAQMALCIASVFVLASVCLWPWYP